MIPLTKFKLILNDYGKDLSDVEIEKIRQDMYVLADISFDFWEKDLSLQSRKNVNDVV